MELRGKQSSPILAVLVMCVGIWSVYVVLSTYMQYRRLKHVRGPLIAAISPAWLFYHTVKGDVYLASQKALKAYGSPVRIAPNQIVSDDPIIARAMMAAKSPFTKGHWFRGMKFDPRQDNILSTQDEAHHAELRNKVIPGYTGKEVPTLEKDVDGRVNELVDFIRSYTEKNAAVDFARAIAFFTMDVLTQIAFGDKLGFLTKDEDVFTYLQSGADFFPIMELGSNHPLILKILRSPIMAGAQPKPTDSSGFGRIVGHTQQVIAERFASGNKEKNDMIASFVRHGLSQLECESESLLQVLAGADSTATALRTTFLHILTSPAVYSRLLREIESTMKSGTVTRPVIKHSEALELPYLQAVIKEGLRMFMPLQGLAGRLPPKGGITVNNVWIPEGTEVGMALYTMLRREDIFGDDADTFRPERWIDSSPEKIKFMAREQELVFGHGRYSCLGKNIALSELGKAIFEILNAYDLTIVNAFTPMSTRSNSVVVQKNFWVRAYPRTS